MATRQELDAVTVGQMRQRATERCRASMNAQLTNLLSPQVTTFWGCRCEFQPELLRKVYGDGKRLLKVFPINERPRYWVVRVDSTCIDDDAVQEILCDVSEEIDKQFGTPNEEDIGVGDERPYFPMQGDDGYAWDFVHPIF